MAFQAAFRKDFTVLLAADLDAAWEHLREHEVHVVICDQRMPGVLGSEALARIRAAYPHVRRMLITAHAEQLAGTFQPLVHPLSRSFQQEVNRSLMACR